MKKLVYLFVSILMAAATSCGTKSDAETEKNSTARGCQQKVKMRMVLQCVIMKH